MKNSLPNPFSLDSIFDLVLLSHNTETRHIDVIYSHCLGLLNHTDFEIKSSRHTIHDLFLITHGHAKKSQYLSAFRSHLIEIGQPWKEENGTSVGWGIQALKMSINQQDAMSLKALLNAPYAPSVRQLNELIFPASPSHIPRPNESSQDLTILGLALFQANQNIDSFPLVDILIRHGVDVDQNISNKNEKTYALDLISSAPLLTKWLEYSDVQIILDSTRCLKAWKNWEDRQEVLKLALKHPITQPLIGEVFEHFQNQMIKDMGWFWFNDQNKKINNAQPLVKQFFNTYPEKKFSAWSFAGRIIEEGFDLFVSKSINQESNQIPQLSSKFLFQLQRPDFIATILSLCKNIPLPAHCKDQPYPGVIFAIIRSLHIEFESGQAFTKKTCLDYVADEGEIDGFREALGDKLQSMPNELLNFSSLSLGHLRTFFTRSHYEKMMIYNITRTHDLRKNPERSAFGYGEGFKKMLEIASSDFKKYLKNQEYTKEFFYKNSIYFTLLLSTHVQNNLQSKIGYESFKKALDEHAPLEYDLLKEPLEDFLKNSNNVEKKTVVQKFFLENQTVPYTAPRKSGPRL